MNSTHYNTEDMNQKGTDVINQSENFGSQLDALRTNINGLLTIWNGDPSGAAETFKMAYDTYDKDLERFRSMLNDLGNAARSSASILEEGEMERTNAAKNLY